MSPTTTVSEIHGRSAQRSCEMCLISVLGLEYGCLLRTRKSLSDDTRSPSCKSQIAVVLRIYSPLLSSKSCVCLVELLSIVTEFCWRCDLVYTWKNTLLHVTELLLYIICDDTSA